MRSKSLFTTLTLLLIASQVIADPPGKHIDPRGAHGRLVIAGGGTIPTQVYEQFQSWAGGDNAQLIIIPTASIRADDPDQVKEIITAWQLRGFKNVAVLHTRDRESADTREFVAPLLDATAVWITGGDQSKLSKAYSDTKVEEELIELLKRGGVIGGSSAGAAIQSKVMIAMGQLVPRIGTGFDLLPGTIIDQHFTQRNRLARLTVAVNRFDDLVGFGIDESTALAVDRRFMKVIGNGNVTVCLGKTRHQNTETAVYADGDYIDLTSMRRHARDRSSRPFPAERVNDVSVNKGSLVIVGGGGMPRPVLDKFIELAGGPEAKIIVLPTSMPDPISSDYGKKMFESVGATNVVVLRDRNKQDVEKASFLKHIKEADAIWFGGGRQWRFVDAYEHTKALPLMHDVLSRGGVIGGSSAGASIQAEFMVRGNPLGNRDPMAAGYTRGFGFIKGCGIDQHFAQRSRFADMSAVVDKHPQLLGIGIDEATALIVVGDVGEVLGNGSVHFYDRQKPLGNGDKDYVSVPSGKSFNLIERELIEEQE